MSDKDYDVGDIVVYVPFGGGTRRVLVDTKEPDIKNGRPGFAGSDLDYGGDEAGVWGYDSQIISVERK